MSQGEMMSIAEAWHALDRKLKFRLMSNAKGRSVVGGLLGRVLVISLCIYMIPALLAVLAVGILGIVLLTIVSALGGAPPGARRRFKSKLALPNCDKSGWTHRQPHSAPWVPAFEKPSGGQGGKAC
jgi:hypothetical protein